MTNYVDVSILVPDSKRFSVPDAVSHLTPSYGLMGFSRSVCPADPTPTWETTPTHWRMADQTLQEYAVIWQYVALEGALPPGVTMPSEATMTEQDIIDAFDGVRVWIGNDVGNSVAWAANNMASLDPVLVDVPEFSFG